MPRLTQEQYKTLQARGWNDAKISSVAKSQGYNMPDNRDLLEKAAGFGERVLGITGGKNIAEIGGSLLAGQSLPQALRTQGGTIGGGIVKTAGDVGQITATIGTTKLPVAKSLKGAIGIGTLLSGAVATAKGISEGKKITTAVKESMLPAAIGGTFFGVGYGVGKLASVITKKAPEVLYQSAIKQSKQDLMKEITGKAPELSKQLIHAGVKGNDNKIYSHAINGIIGSEKKITGIASGDIGSQLIQTTKITSSLDNLIRRSRNVFGDEGSIAIENVKQNILNKGETISIRDALQLKRDIYNELSKSAFNVDSSLSNKAEALRSIAGSLAENIAEGSDEIAGLTKSQQMWIRTAKAIEGKAGTARNNIIGLSDSILGAASLVSGNVAALIPTVGRRVLETTTAKTNVAILLNRLSKIPTDSAGKISKTAIINLLKNLQ